MLFLNDLNFSKGQYLRQMTLVHLKGQQDK